MITKLSVYVILNWNPLGMTAMGEKYTKKVNFVDIQGTSHVSSFCLHVEFYQ